uniref:Putative secreted peptide n=1 Tax=Anopheles braziliensis TaxID=58242 RepID=A0A2M3ZP76_9DIPT
MLVLIGGRSRPPSHATFVSVCVCVHTPTHATCRPLLRSPFCSNEVSKHRSQRKLRIFPQAFPFVCLFVLDSALYNYVFRCATPAADTGENQL